MSARRQLSVAALAATIALASAPVAFGQKAAVVQGGGSFDAAPVLSAGSYTDTILPLETLFYSVALAEGQRLRVDTVVDFSVGTKDSRGVPFAFGGFDLRAFTPLRQGIDASAGGELDPDPEMQIDHDRLRVPRVRRAALADRLHAEGPDAWRGPGIYTFTAAISETYGGLGATVEFPLRLTLTIDGPSTPAGGVGPGPFGQSGAAGADAKRRVATAAAPSGGAGPGRPSAAVLAAGGVGGLVAGALLAMLAVGVMRRARE